MLNHLQKAFELDPVIHSRVVSMEEKKIQSEDKILLEFALRIQLLNHNYFYTRDSFQTEEAFETWKDFAKHDILHSLSSFQFNVKSLMSTAQEFLNNMVCFVSSLFVFLLLSSQ